MNIQSLLPPAALSSYVRSIMVIEHPQDRDGFVLPLYANGTPTLVFQSTRGQRNGSQVGHISVYGQAVAPTNLFISERFVLIAYFLHPYAIKAILGITAGELTNTLVDVNDLKPAKAISLQEQLLNAPSVAAQLKLINAFLLRRITNDCIDYSRIAFATAALQKDASAEALGKLRDQLFSTERSVQRLFEDQVGISPKLYKRICQFHMAFQQLNHFEFVKLSDIAYRNGFSDQSHFIRVFKEFTGMSPKDYLALRAGYTSEK